MYMYIYIYMYKKMLQLSQQNIQLYITTIKQSVMGRLSYEEYLILKSKSQTVFFTKIKLVC